MSAILENAMVLLVPLARLTGFFLVIPAFSHRAISVRIKMLLVLALCILISGNGELGNRVVLKSDQPLTIATAVLQEIVIGGLLALPARLIFLGVSIYGEIIANSIGLSNSFTLSRDEENQETVISNCLSTGLVTLVFVSNTHLIFIRNFVLSYQMPEFQMIPGPEITLVYVVNSIITMFTLSVKLSAPFLLLGLGANATAGLINRMIPQVPIYFVTVPVLLFIGILAMTQLTPAALIEFIVKISVMRN